MWVLALDTTTRDGSVALVRDDAVVVARPGEAGVSHAERVPSDLRSVLAEAGVKLAEVDLFAVATGPGGFTGLRIGLAAVQGLATALDRPVAGVPSLAALAWDLLERESHLTTAAAWMDASRGEVFAAAYARRCDAPTDDAAARPGAAAPARSWPMIDIAPATAASPAGTIAAWQTSVPQDTPIAAACTAEASAVATAAGRVVVAPATLLAGVIGRIAWRMHTAGQSGAAASLAPEYVRRPDVEIERDRQRASGVRG